jgi:hypothetical protein
MMPGVQVIAHIAEPWRSHISLGVCKQEPDGFYVVHDPQFVKVGEAVPIGPSFTLTIEAAQALMDSLWQCGLRPTEGAGSAGALAATQAHLADMRKLVFDYLAKHPVVVSGPNLNDLNIEMLKR